MCNSILVTVWTVSSVIAHARQIIGVVQGGLDPMAIGAKAPLRCKTPTLQCYPPPSNSLSMIAVHAHGPDTTTAFVHFMHFDAFRDKTLKWTPGRVVFANGMCRRYLMTLLHTFVVWFLLFVLCSDGSVISSWCGCGDSTTQKCRVWPSLTHSGSTTPLNTRDETCAFVAPTLTVQSTSVSAVTALPHPAIQTAVFPPGGPSLSKTESARSHVSEKTPRCDHLKPRRSRRPAGTHFPANIMFFARDSVECTESLVMEHDTEGSTREPSELEITRRSDKWKCICCKSIHWWPKMPISQNTDKHSDYTTLSCQYSDDSNQVFPRDHSIWRRRFRAHVLRQGCTKKRCTPHGEGDPALAPCTTAAKFSPAKPQVVVMSHLALHGVHQMHVHVFSFRQHTAAVSHNRVPVVSSYDMLPRVLPKVFCHDMHARVRTTQHQEHRTENPKETTNTNLSREPHAHDATQKQRDTHSVQAAQLWTVHYFLSKAIMNCADRRIASLCGSFFC